MGCISASANRRKAAFAFRQRGVRDRNDPVRHHRRLPHRRRRQRCRRRDGVDHQRLERALAELAEQQPHQEVAFRRGRAREQLGEDASALGLRARARDRSDARERGVDVGNRQRGFRGGSGGARIAHERVADAASSLPRLARQIGDADLDFRRARACAGTRRARRSWRCGSRCRRLGAMSRRARPTASSGFLTAGLPVAGSAGEARPKVRRATRNAGSTTS